MKIGSGVKMKTNRSKHFIKHKNLSLLFLPIPKKFLFASFCAKNIFSGKNVKIIFSISERLSFLSRGLPCFFGPRTNDAYLRMSSQHFIKECLGQGTNLGYFSSHLFSFSRAVPQFTRLLRIAWFLSVLFLSAFTPNKFQKICLSEKGGNQNQTHDFSISIPSPRSNSLLVMTIKEAQLRLFFIFTSLLNAIRLVWQFYNLTAEII